MMAADTSTSECLYPPYNCMIEHSIISHCFTRNSAWHSHAFLPYRTHIFTLKHCSTQCTSISEQNRQHICMKCICTPAHIAPYEADSGSLCHMLSNVITPLPTLSYVALIVGSRWGREAAMLYAVTHIHNSTTTTEVTEKFCPSIQKKVTANKRLRFTSSHFKQMYICKYTMVRNRQLSCFG